MIYGKQTVSERWQLEGYQKAEIVMQLNGEYWRL